MFPGLEGFELKKAQLDYLMTFIKEETWWGHNIETWEINANEMVVVRFRTNEKTGVAPVPLSFSVRYDSSTALMKDVVIAFKRYFEDDKYL